MGFCLNSIFTKWALLVGGRGHKILGNESTWGLLYKLLIGSDGKGDNVLCHVYIREVTQERSVLWSSLWINASCYFSGMGEKHKNTQKSHFFPHHWWKQPSTSANCCFTWTYSKVGDWCMRVSVYSVCVCDGGKGMI